MRIRKRPKHPISASDLETQALTHATHVGGSSFSPIGGAPQATADEGVLLHLDGDLPRKSSGCNRTNTHEMYSSVGGGDLLLIPPPVPTPMKGAAHLKRKGEERTDVLGNLNSFHSNCSSSYSSRNAESSFSEEKKKKKRIESMEVGDNNRKKAGNTKCCTSTTTTVDCDEKKSTSKRKSPALLMEGSRCSRVNGRGWRCCQQTLVGYSLCEHHLGKGRLRSVNNNNNKNNSSSSRFKSNSTKMMRNLQQEEGSEEEEQEMKVLISTGRRRKIGIVKARSISSLLVDTCCNNNKNNNSNVNAVIVIPKDEVLVGTAATGRTDQVSSMEVVSSATMV